MSKTFIDIVGRDLTQGAFDSAGRRLNTLSGTVSSLKGALGALGVGFSAVASISTAVSAASQFEDALIGVAKTTGLAGRDLEIFSGRIDQISKTIPITTSELLTLAQAAGQMGVTGADSLEKFSVTIAKLGKSSDLAGEEAAKSLARILNVTGESVDSVETLASVFVALGNNVAASESEIARITNEVARSAGVFGVTSAEAAAMGAAMSSVGIRAEAGGSAVGRAMQEITSRVKAGGKDLTQFAEALELNEEVLVSLFSENKTKAFEFFLEQVGELGLEAGNALDSVGLGGQEIAKTIIPLAQNMGIFAETLEIANAEVKDATALNNEFEATLVTLSSEWQITKNVMESFAKSIGESLLPSLNAGLQGLNSFFAGASAASGIEKQTALIADLEAELQHLTGLSGVFGIFGPTKKDFDLLESQLENAKLDLDDLTVAAQESAEALKSVAADSDIKSLVDPIKDVGDEGGKTGLKLKDLAKESDTFLKSLSKQASEAGKVGLALDRYRAKVLGVSKEAEKLISIREEGNKQLKIEQDALRKAGEDLSRIESITRSLRTEEEIFLDTQKELDRLLGEGLGFNTYTRALQQAQDELRGVESTTRTVTNEVSQMWVQAGRNIQSSLADSIFNFFDDGLKGMVKNVKNAVGRIASEFAALKIAQSIGLTASFSGSGAGGGGISFFDGANLLSAGNTIYQGFSGALAANAGSLIAGAGGAVGSGSSVAFGTALAGDSIGGLIAGTEAGLSGAAAAEAASAGSAAASGATAATGFGLLALATSISNQLLANNKRVGGLNSDDINSIDSTFDSVAGFVGTISSLGSGRFLTEQTIGKIPGIGGFLEKSILSFIPDIGSHITAFFGRSVPKLRETNLIGQATGEGFTGVTSSKIKQEGGAFRGDKTRRVVIDADTLELSAGSTRKFGDFAESLKPSIELLNFTLDGALALMNDNISETSKLLGLGSTEGFSTNINIASKKGEFFTADQITEELLRIEGDFIRHVLPSIDNLVREGETVVQAFQRLGVEYDTLTNAVNVLGFSSEDAKAKILGLSVESRTGIVDAFGGIDALNQKVGFFADNFLSDSEKVDLATQGVNNALEEFGTNADSLSKNEFGELIKTFFLMGEEGANSATKLLELTDSFLLVKDAAAQLTASNKRQLDALQNLGNTRAEAKEILSAFADVDIDKFIQGAGGIDKFISDTSTLSNILFTSAEKSEQLGDALREALDFGGFESLDSFAKIRDAVLGLGKEASLTGEDFNSLKDILVKNAPALSLLKDEFEASKKPVDELKDTLESLSDASARAARNAAGLAKFFETKDILGDVVRLLNPSKSPDQQRGKVSQLQDGGVFQQAIDLAGGAGNFKKNFDLISANLFDAQELEEFLSQSVSAALKAVSVQSVTTDVDILGINSLESFKSVLQSLGEEGGITSQQFASLLNITPLLIEQFAELAVAETDLIDTLDNSAAIADQRLSLERELLELQGDTAAIRSLELDALFPANRALKERVFALIDEQAAAEVANQINEQRLGLESQLLELQGNTAELRRLEVEALHPSNQALQLRIFALQDEQVALENLRSGVTDAFSGLESSVSAEREAVANSFNAQIDSTRNSIDSVSNSIGKLSSLVDFLDDSVNSITALSKNEARNQIQGIIDSGSTPEIDDIRRAVNALTNTSTSGFSSREDFLLDQSASASLLKDLGVIAEGELTLQERSLAALEAQLARTESSFASELLRLDNILLTANNQVLATQGVSTAVLTVNQSVINLGSSISNLNARRTQLRPVPVAANRESGDNTELVAELKRACAALEKIQTSSGRTAETLDDATQGGRSIVPTAA